MSAITAPQGKGVNHSLQARVIATIFVGWFLLQRIALRSIAHVMRSYRGIYWRRSGLSREYSPYKNQP